jgi:nucleoside-diphosphate-sugar epimerase
VTYCLLTGATGIVGRYLLKDCLIAGVPLAVLVRCTSRETARQRIESVMGYWEQRLGRPLPRPVVLEGDVRAPDAGLSPRAVRWIAGHCDTLLHSAASMTFHAGKADGEPFQTNVVGTRNLLELCHRSGIRNVHHISTAYVCGLRQGLVREDELDLGQMLGNDYERSKLEAERLFRSDPFLRSVTVYRPASIIGDSQTGYTTNFHGFYLPLQLLHSLLRSLGTRNAAERQYIIERAMRARFLGRLKLQGDEEKNFVPVDWVAAVTASILVRPEHHGRTYHLTPLSRVSTRTVRGVIERVLREAFDLPVETDGEMPDEVETTETEDLERFFSEQMSVYQSHWRDDPHFDCSGVRSAAAHLPCPTVDREMLLQTARFAIEANFGWPRPAPARVAFDLFTHLESWMDAGQPGSPSDQAPQIFGLEVTGPGGGQCHLLVRGGQIRGADWGLPSACETTYHLHSATFAALAERKLTAAQAVDAGFVVIEGNSSADSQRTEVLQQVATPAATWPDLDTRDRSYDIPRQAG